ncbi:hypothetical protein ACFQ51_06285 [Streptomyces kaempferi]
MRDDRRGPAPPLRLRRRGLRLFDHFAEPAPELRQRALAAVQEGLGADRIDEDRAHHHGRLLQAYETAFWHALWEQDQRVA